MKKQNLLKLAFTVMAMFVYLGVMAQTYPATINHGADITDYEAVTDTTYQTVGYGFKLYVAPDPVYSPDYDGSDPADINAASQWQWVYGATFGAGTVVEPWAAANYVDLVIGDLPAAGSTRDFWVAERFSASCSDLTGVKHPVRILPNPDATMIGDGENDGTLLWEVTSAGLEFYLCGEGHTDDLIMTFVEPLAPIKSYVYNITVTATGYDEGGAPVVGPTDVTGSFNLATPAGGIAGVVSTDFAASPITVTTAAMNFVEDGGVDVRTKYEFTLAGVSSRMLALSQTRAAAATAYVAPTAAQVVTYWLNLPPVTGPIYHIPNDYAF